MERKSPDAARRPAYTTRTASASRSTSSRMWDENRIDPPSAAIRWSRLHHVQPLAGIHAVERLVEQQDPRLVDERRGELARWRMPFE